MNRKAAQRDVVRLRAGEIEERSAVAMSLAKLASGKSSRPFLEDIPPQFL